jgi:hypothetical protein
MTDIAAGHAANRHLVDQDWLASPNIWGAVIEHKAAQLAAQPTLFLGQQRGATDEISFT